MRRQPTVAGMNRALEAAYLRELLLAQRARGAAFVRGFYLGLALGLVPTLALVGYAVFIL